VREAGRGRAVQVQRGRDQGLPLPHRGGGRSVGRS
jgi:hypothetical protein